MAERETEREERASDPGWTRRAITGLLAGTGLSALIGAETDAKKKKKKKKKKGKGKGSPKPTPPTCTRSCGGRECGGDGCGGSCGDCETGTICEEGQCLAPNAYEFDRLWYHGLENPWGLAVDHDDNVFVADSNHHRIVKFSSTGDMLLEWGSYGSEPGQFNQPAGVAVSKAGQVYIADNKNHRIQKYSSIGEPLASFGMPGPAAGQLQNPVGIAVNKEDGTLFIIESGMNRVQWFAESSFMASWELEELGAFDTRSVTVGKGGVVYVVNTSGGTILRLNYNGTIKDTIGAPGSGDGQLSGPWDVAVDDNGNIFVADRGNNRVQVFDKDGAFVTGWGTQGGGEGQLHQPMGIDVDSKGNVYVTELANARVQKFRPTVARRNP